MARGNGNGSDEAVSDNSLNDLQVPFGFQGPIGLRLAVETAAKEARLPVAAFLKKVTADAVGYSISIAPRQGQMTDAEKEEAKKAAQEKAAAERKAAREALEAARKSAGLVTAEA